MLLLATSTRWSRCSIRCSRSFAATVTRKHRSWSMSRCSFPLSWMTCRIAGFDITYVGPPHCDAQLRAGEMKRAISNLAENACHYGTEVVVHLMASDERHSHSGRRQWPGRAGSRSGADHRAVPAARSGPPAQYRRGRPRAHDCVTYRDQCGRPAHVEQPGRRRALRADRVASGSASNASSHASR